MHDGKMLYLLTQHLAWSRKHNPFLLCKCKQGEGVTNNDSHVCIPISHDEQVLLYNRSEKRWEQKRSRLKEGESYEVAHHRDWVAEENFGASHFGLSPEMLCRDDIRFDVFHLAVAITK